jgi:hypothetical protein
MMKSLTRSKPVARRDDDDLPAEVPAAYAGLPALMAEFAEVAGLDAAVKLFSERGGNRVYIPSRCADDHWLVAMIGREATDKVCAHFSAGGGVELELPRGPTGLKAAVIRRLHDMIRHGATSTEITRTLGISRDMVKDHRRRLRNTLPSPQLELFDLLAGDEHELLQLPKPGVTRRR